MEFKYALITIGISTYFLINFIVLIVWFSDYFESIDNFGYDENFTGWKILGVVAQIFFFAIPMFIYIIGQIICRGIKEKINDISHVYR